MKKIGKDPLNQHVKTSKLKMHLKADTGFVQKSEHKISINQWVRINEILAEKS